MAIQSFDNSLYSAHTLPEIPSDWWDARNSSSFFATVYREGDDSLEGNLLTSPMNMGQRTQRECSIIERMLHPHKGDTILDCPCGIGRHSIELAHRGYSLQGVDIDGRALECAKEHASARRLEHKTKFRQADMRYLPLPDGSMQYVVNMFLSFGFFSDDADNFRVLSEFFRVLRPGGKVVLHTDVNPLRLENLSYGDRKLRSLPDNGYLVVDEMFNRSTRRLEGMWLIYRSGQFDKAGAYSVRIYNHTELNGMFKQAGFLNTRIYNVNCASLCSDPLSQEIIYVATKGVL